MASKKDLATNTACIMQDRLYYEYRHRNALLAAC